MAGAFAGLLAFSLQLASAATLTIDNQAAATYREPATGNTIPFSSNTVAVQTTASPPRIRFFTNSTFVTEAAMARIGSQLFISAEIAACNRDPGRTESVDVTVRSVTSGDWETHSAEETAPDSGVFRTDDHWTTENVLDVSRHLAGAATFMVLASDSDTTLESAPDDILHATADSCGGDEVSDSLLIDPAGYLFDSETNEAITGVRIQLVDVTGNGNGGHPGEAAAVYLDSDGTPGPAELITDAQGMFKFPLVAPGTYRLAITPPDEYMLSRKAADALPRNRRINLPGSFGGNFEVSASTGAVLLDVPLDPVVHGLSIQKTAAQPVVMITASVQYTIVVRNVSSIDLDGVTVNDRLPVGFRYVDGTTRLDGERTADPAGEDVALSFALGSLRAGESRTLTYRSLVGPGALQGDGINRASASSESPVRTSSNTAAARVEVEPGVFDDRAFILGKVYADCNANSTKDAGESGLPGVRLYLEDGTYAVTDAQGNYSFYGVSPRTHVLKVDDVTLPAGITLAVLGQRNAGKGDSLFIDAKRGELVRADFATRECPAGPAIPSATVAVGQELSRTVGQELQTASMPVADARALPAAGTIDALRPIARTVADGARPAQIEPIEKAVLALTSEPGFFGLEDGTRVGTRQQTIRVKGLAGAELTLFLNDLEVPGSRVGTRVVNEGRKVVALEFVGVELAPGRNHLTLTQKDGFGNLRGSASLSLIAPGDLARISIRLPAERAIADGVTLVPIEVLLEDEAGTPVDVRLPVTLGTSAGEWQTPDLDANEPGTQTFLETGTSRLLLRAPDAATDARITIESGTLEAQAVLPFMPALRPLLGAGLVEGTLSLNKLGLKSLSPARRDDGFEEELAALAGGQGKDTTGTRAALFLKGKVKGDYLLTLGFDSEKDTRERLFRDIVPDRFYPVYGDASTKGFDAQSTGRLYVRLDKEKSYLLAGDFTTQSIETARNLGAYQRSLNGIKEHYENSRVTANAFASRDTTRQIVEEVPANGTSGPYPLGQDNVVENSEQVEILTRDRNQPELVVGTVTLVRFTDYEIDTFTGRLVFRAPVPSLDADLNPVSIRITYEVDQGGEDFWVSGVDAQVRVTGRVTLGGAAIEDANPAEGLSMQSVNATVKLGDHITALAEVARTDRDALGTGFGERIEVRHDSAALKARLYAGETDVDFFNRSATLGSGRREAGFKSAYALDERTRLIADAIHTSSVATAAKRYGGLLGFERKVGEESKVEFGMRQVHDQPGAADATATDTTSARVKATTPLPGVERAQVYGEYEQDLSDEDNRLAAVGGDYRLNRSSRLYVRHELISSLTGPYDLDGTSRRNATVVGLARNHETSQVFSEYRVGNSLSAREAEAAIGLRHRCTLATGLHANTSLEKVDSVSGNAAESTAVAGSLDYVGNPLWKATSRLELRRTPGSDTLFSTLGWAWQFADDWSLLAKNVLALTDNDSQPDRLQERFRAGVAYRDNTTNRLNALARYELRRESGTETGTARSVHMLSAHANLQIDATTVITGQYATSYSLERIGGDTIRGHAQLVAGRISHDFGSRWDASLAVRNLFGGEFDSNQFGIGVEAGYLVMDNLWLSAGYNVLGFHDRDLSADEYTRKGGYLRLRFKFDESILERL